MIKITRQDVDAPKILFSVKVRQDIDKAKVYFSKKIEDRNREYFTFRKDLLQSTEVRNALMRLFHSKCSYCENTFSIYSYPVIDRFRPLSRSINLDGSIDIDHYWWLAYEWSNIYLCCVQCNRMKAERFPIGDRRAELLAKESDLLLEKPLLIDPCLDDPHDHLSFLDNGTVVGRTDRGQITVEVLGLNRMELVASRVEEIESIRLLLNEYKGRKSISSLGDFASEVQNLLKPVHRYSALRRQFIHNWLMEEGLEAVIQQLDAPIFPSSSTTVSDYSNYQNNKEVSRVITNSLEHYSVEAQDIEQNTAYYQSAKKIERIELRNFKGIKSLDIDFPITEKESEPWLMLIGENGTGKSSILQAVALALMGENRINSLGLNASKYVRRNESKGDVKIHITGLSSPILLSFNRASPKFNVHPEEPKVLLLAYGATRLLPLHSNNKELSNKHIRIKNLFNPMVPLLDAEIWLADLAKSKELQFRQVVMALKDILDFGPRDDISLGRKGIEVKLSGKRLSLNELSDGYQSILGLVVDIASSMLEKWDDLQSAEGIVLLDEIEVHLHPDWKLRIVEKLRSVFPRLAFITTTHDPLCLKGLEPEEIAILQRDDEEEIYIEINTIPVDEWRADQILTSSLFGLNTTRSLKITTMVNRYSQLMGKQNKTKVEESEFKDLGLTLKEILDSGETPLQRLMERVIRKELHNLQLHSEIPEEIYYQASETLILEVRRQIMDLVKTMGINL